MSDKPKFPAKLARSVGEKIVEALSPVCARIQIAGSLRRGKPLVGDVEIVYVPRFTEVSGVEILTTGGAMIMTFSRTQSRRRDRRHNQVRVLCPNWRSSACGNVVQGCSPWSEGRPSFRGFARRGCGFSAIRLESEILSSWSVVAALFHTSCTALASAPHLSQTFAICPIYGLNSLKPRSSPAMCCKSLISAFFRPIP